MSYIDETKRKLEDEGLKKLEALNNEAKNKLDDEYKKKTEELKGKYDSLVEEFVKRLS